MDRLKVFFSNRTNLVLSLSLLFIIIGIGIGAQKFLASKQNEILEEINLQFDPSGPYALLIPRGDGDALNLNITRVGSYEQFSYELVYSSLISEVEHTDAEAGSGKVDRSAGDLKTFIKLNGKSDFKQEILFGTCSQGYTTGGSHCVFDQGVENGTLTLKMQKDHKLYKMGTTWHLQQPDVALGVITSVDGHFSYITKADRQELVTVGYTIVNDLSGAPKFPDGKKVMGSVYALNVPNTRVFPKGDVKIELIDNPPAEAKIARFVQADNSWQMLDTKIEGSKLTASADGNGIFAVLVNDKSH